MGLEIRERDEPIPWMYCIYVILLVGEWGYRLEKESGTHTLDVLHLYDSPGGEVGLEIRKREKNPYPGCIVLCDSPGGGVGLEVGL